MKEYIEKADAINLLWLFADESCASVVSDFEGLPAADVAEVRHGRWDASDRYKFLDGSTCIRCTECGAALHLDEYQKYHWHYCPNCGARMDEEDEHELIDRSELLDKFNLECKTAQERYMALINAPTISAVPVVRCRECKHYKPEEYFSPCVLPQGLECAKPNDFCSYGQRKEAAHE